jgi:aminopeptidase
MPAPRLRCVVGHISKGIGGYDPTRERDPSGGLGSHGAHLSRPGPVAEGTAARIERLAELVVGFGVNVQPGQMLEVTADIGKEEVVRAIARRAYEAGAIFVDVTYFDLHVKRARLELASEDTLEFVPPWYGDKVLSMGENRAATVLLTGPSFPHLLEDLDPARVARDRLPSLKEYVTVINQRTVNWSLAPCPTPAWAKLVHPDLEDDDAFERLWDEIEHFLRLDEADPVATWDERMDELGRAGERLTALGLDALRFEGPGTDLTVGLLPSSRWLTARAETVDGIPHVVNLPSEEVFTTPDPERVDGVVAATMPLELQGFTVDGLRVRFEGGRAVEIDADVGADAVQELTRRDEGAGRIGEVALVDREGRIGPLQTVFYDTLLDENAASHMALGNAYESAVAGDDVARANTSEIHVDFMIGSGNVVVTGLTRDGRQVPVLRDGAWQL